MMELLIQSKDLFMIIELPLQFLVIKLLLINTLFLLVEYFLQFIGLKRIVSGEA